MNPQTTKRWESESQKLDREFSGVTKHTKPLTVEEKKWLQIAVRDTAPKIPVTIRLKRWQIERAKQIAKERHLKGYQTLISQILTESLI